MTAPEDPKKRQLCRLPHDSDYAVGYGKPPVDTRFRKGQSGNPKGRPRGSRNRKPRLNEERLKQIILDEAYRTIKVNDGGRQVSVPMAQAVVRSLAHSAVKGNQRAQRLFTELLTTTERDNMRLHNEWLDVAITYKIEWERELDRRKRIGVVAEDPIPHPDDIIVDMRTGVVRIAGPMTREEKAELEMWADRKAEFEAELSELEQMLIDAPDTPNRKFIEDDIKHTKKVLDMIAKVIPD